MLNGGGANFAFVRPRPFATWSIEDQIDFFIFKVVNQVGVALCELLDRCLLYTSDAADD